MKEWKHQCSSFKVYCLDEIIYWNTVFYAKTQIVFVRLKSFRTGCCAALYVNGDNCKGNEEKMLSTQLYEIYENDFFIYNDPAAFIVHAFKLFSAF